MFAGLTPYIRRDNVEAFYREVSTDWYFLRGVQKSGAQAITCEEWREARAASVDIRVQDLAELQMEIPVGAEWRSTTPPELDLEAIAQRGIATDWDWRKLQKEFPKLEQRLTGLAFEDFFSALVRASGATNIVKGLKLWQGGMPRHEFDVIVSTGQKIVVFDLKLRREEDDPVIDQFSRLGEDRSCLGGLGADAIAVRSSWEDKPVNAALAKAHQLTLWTQKDMSQLVEKIGQVLQVIAGSPEEAAAKVASQAALTNANQTKSAAKEPTPEKTQPAHCTDKLCS